MSRRQFIISAIAILATMAVCAENESYAHEKAVEHYVYLRALRNNVSEGTTSYVPKPPFTCDGKTVLSVSEAKAFIESKRYPFNFTSDTCVQQFTKPDYKSINGFDLAGYGARLIQAGIGAVSPPTYLYCVYDSERIYELSNEAGFQESAATAWYRANSSVPKEVKCKVIATAIFLYDDRTMLGYIADANDFKLMASLLPVRPSDETPCEKEREKDMQWWLQGHATYYSTHPLRKSASITYFVRVDPGQELLRLEIHRKKVRIYFECTVPCYGMWANDGTLRVFGVRL